MHVGRLSETELNHWIVLAVLALVLASVAMMSRHRLGHRCAALILTLAPTAAISVSLLVFGILRTEPTRQVCQHALEAYGFWLDAWPLLVLSCLVSGVVSLTMLCFPDSRHPHIASALGGSFCFNAISFVHVCQNFPSA